ncbi:MAG: sugar ABC transporter permease, partial [Catenibacillus sp.]
MKKCLKNFGAELKKNRALFMMILPAAIIIIIFSYLPMSGLVLAFKDYRYNLGVFGSEWNGLENFRFLFESGTGWLITKNTILYNLLNLVTSQGLAILIAVAITEMKV